MHNANTKVKGGKLLMENKKGANALLTTFIIVGIIAMVGLLGFVVVKVASPQSGIAVTTQEGTSGSLCQINPAFVVTGNDALVPTSNISVTTNYFVGGNAQGTSYSPANGEKVLAIADATGYLATSKEVTAGCGNNPVKFSLYSYGNATVSVKSDAGTSILTSTGTVNETAFTSGQTKNNEISLTAPSQKSTGKIFVYLEMPSNSASNVSSTQLSCNGVTVNSATIPSFISSTNTNAYRAGWEIAPINNGQKVVCNLQQAMLSGKTLAGTVRVTYYAEQPFVDTDGTLVANGIYDKLGTAKYQDSYTSNWYLA